MTSNPKPLFPFDNDDRLDNSWIDKENCPCCKIPFSEHTNNQIVRCALIELKGGKI
jgi:hypothetical protein